MRTTTTNGNSMSQERVIRKYANRRLYDSEASRHVTLADLRQLVVSGKKIKVIDDKTGEDLTRSVLLQIIAEQEQFGSPVLTTELMEMIIRFYSSPVQSMLTGYLEQGFATLLRQQEAMRAEMNKVLGTPPMSPFVDLARANMEAFARMQATFFGAANTPAAAGTGTGTSTTAGTAAGTGPKSNTDENQ